MEQDTEDLLTAVSTLARMAKEQTVTAKEAKGNVEEAMRTLRDTFPIPTESVEQQRLFQWVRMAEGAHPELQMLYHIPNEGKRGRAGGRRMVAEGLRRGVPDLCLPVARGGWHGLYIELKRTRGGRVSSDQAEWLRRLRAEGYAAQVCNGWEEAAVVLLAYLSIPKGEED